MKTGYKTDAEIEDVVRGLETCSTGKDDFQHYKHLVVAVYYLRTSTREQAFTKMRAGLLRFIEYHEIDRNIYSDELTKAWIHLVADELESIDPTLPAFEAVNTIMDRLNDKDAVFKRGYLKLSEPEKENSSGHP
ncbi:MAG TPA: hypothetical protein VJT50_12275 [Pyrinomonadaceae bacterium]|nr:hypothetical protein [Pyrinomonadaceae bacterium]